MQTPAIKQKLVELNSRLSGELFTDDSTLIMYSTDASVYREKPLAVARPMNKGDIMRLIDFAIAENISLIPRTAGTSLSGQVVGNGIVVDVSKYLTNILELNVEEHWVRVQPGVVLDELNKSLAQHSLFFGPETSTSNRCMIGGMVGNNSCGAHSILYGSTRDHVLEIKGYLAEAAPDQENREVLFAASGVKEFEEKCNIIGLEGDIYRNIREILSETANQENIRKEFPHPEIHRRNTGYAIDLLLETEPFTKGKPAFRSMYSVYSGDQPEPFNFCKLISGSEGTLMFMTEIKLNLVPLPPKERGLVAVHCKTLEDAFSGNLVALKYAPGSVELIDHIIIECTKDNIEQRKNRFFIEGEPEAILIVEFERETREEIKLLAAAMETAMRSEGYGYYFPVIYGPDINKVWALRKAGLGLLSNVPGDAKPVTVIEDTAVRPDDLPAYMRDFKTILKENGLDCVYYAHIATGELHLKPVLDLKNPKDLILFRKIGTEIASLVKKYRGSLSGEHGDGRLRGEFIPLMIGDRNYELIKKVKNAWDPQGVFNPGKITATPPMDRFLRYESGQKVREISTYFDFSKTHGMLRAVEKCNGSGDCRKTEIIGGTMCPSYMATRNENSTTRARANILREFLTNSPKSNPFDHKEIYDVLDLCLSCKACKSECPSNVDMAKYKAEFLQHWYDAHGAPLRSKLIANISKLNKFGMIAPEIFNFFVTNSFFATPLKNLLGFGNQRSIPELYKFTLRSWLKNVNTNSNPKDAKDRKKVYLFVDEFTDYNDVEVGIKAVKLLQALGYQVSVPDHIESGRTYISKGFLKKAKSIANVNVGLLKDLITEETPLIGLEPSAILSFRDEYPELVSEKLVRDAELLGKSALLIEEFIVREFEKGNIRKDQFTDSVLEIKLHGHCQQKAVASTLSTKKMLSIPVNYSVDEIKSGCCGMAGSFGYEKEHYEVSMKVGELVLFPEIRKTSETVEVSAPGTSCRHQIKDGTGRKAKHPAEVLFEALKA